MQFQEILVMVDTGVKATNFFTKKLFWNVEGDEAYLEKRGRMKRMGGARLFHFRLEKFYIQRFDLLHEPTGIASREIGRAMERKRKEISEMPKFWEIVR